MPRLTVPKEHTKLRPKECNLYTPSERIPTFDSSHPSIIARTQLNKITHLLWPHVVRGIE